MKKFVDAATRTHAKLIARCWILQEKGQGTTEYAILVGVLAVIAMLAIAAFRERISELWNAITTGVNGL